jgi:hypothetical protein
MDVTYLHKTITAHNIVCTLLEIESSHSENMNTSMTFLL